MKKIIGILLVLILPNSVLAQNYVGIGGGSASGDGWSDSSPEVFVSRLFESGLQLELGLYDLGSRNSLREEEAKGLLAMEVSYSFRNEFGYLNFGGGVYAYHSDYRTGDAFYGGVGTAPVVSASSGYFFNNNLSFRVKYSKYFLEDDFGSPNRISVALVYSF